MKKNIKIIASIILVLISLLLFKTDVFATNENIHILETEDNYVIFINKDIVKNEFKFAISENKLDPDDIELTYLNSSKIDEDNFVAVIKKENFLNIKYLYLKDENKTVIPISFENEDIILKSEIEKIEKITNIIETETSVKKIIEEQKDKVKYEETIGVLNFKEDADYKYIFEKSPSENYKKLKEYSDILKNEYSKMDGYSKIDLIKKYNDLLSNLVKNASENGKWKNAVEKQIIQEKDSLNGDEYAYIIEQVKDGEAKYDVKFLTVTRTDTLPELKEEKIEIKKDSKFPIPITGDNFCIFVAVLVVSIVLFVILRKKS